MLCGNANVHIIIGDVNDNFPEFDQGTYTTDVCFHNAVVGMTLIQPVATDRDSAVNAEVRYSLVNSSSLLNVNPLTGQVILARTPLSSDISTHEFVMIAENGPLSGLTEGIVRVLNCTEHTFYFTSPFHKILIYEGQNAFSDGSVTVEISLSQIPLNVTFSPDLPSNPFINTLNVRGERHCIHALNGFCLFQCIELKAPSDLLEDLREGVGLNRRTRSLYTIVLLAHDSNQQVTSTTVSTVTLKPQSCNC